MNKYTIEVTKIAYNHMEEIVNYISRELFSPYTANKLLDNFYENIESLAEMPHRYPLVQEEPWRSEGVRKLIVKNYLIYFWVDETNMKVQILAVIYDKRNQLEQLKKLENEKMQLLSYWLRDSDSKK